MKNNGAPVVYQEIDSILPESPENEKMHYKRISA
jgi:hypothetical protein